MRAPLLSLVLVAAACGGAPARPGPDVLLVSVDTLRADRVGAWGHTRDTTPTLDALVARGVRFAEAHAPAPHTAPSHMSAFTGLDPVAHGVHNIGGGGGGTAERLADAVPTLAERMRAAGWTTASFTDRGNITPVMGFDRGFGEVSARYEPLPDKVARAVAWLEARPADEPVRLFFHSYAVHSPYLPRAPFAGRYVDPAYDGPFRARYEELVGEDPAEVHDLAREFLEPVEGMGAADFAYLSDLYDEGVAEADAQLAPLLEAWTARRGPDTVVVLMSDHGEEFGERGALGHVGGLNRELVHVPLAIVAPELAPRVVEAPVSLTALAPTLLELLGLEPLDAQCASLLPFARGEAGAVERVYAQDTTSRKRGRLTAVRAGDWRLISTNKDGEVTHALYAADDPDEARDRGADEPDVTEALATDSLARLRAGLERYAAHPPRELRADDPDLLRELGALGYAGDDEDE